MEHGDGADPVEPIAIDSRIYPAFAAKTRIKAAADQKTTFPHRDLCRFYAATHPGMPGMYRDFAY